MTETNLIRGWTWEDVVCRLGEHVDLEESARAKGAIKRTRTIKTAEQLLRLVLAYVLSGLSFRGTAAWAEATGHASLSDVALLKRLRGCKDWLGELVSRMAAVTCAEASCAGEGRRVVAVDATAVCSPGDKRDYQLLHVVYDVTLQRFVGTELTDRHVAERLDLGGIEPGEIRLGDRVYGRFRDLSAVGSMQSCWLRLSSKSNGPRPKSSGRTLSAGQQISPASSALALHRASCLRPDPRGPCRPQIRSNSRLQNPRTARRAPTPTMYAGKPRLARMGLDPATHATLPQAGKSLEPPGQARGRREKTYWH